MNLPAVQVRARLGLAKLFFKLGWGMNARACLEEAELIADEFVVDPKLYLRLRIECAKVERLIYLPEI